MKIKIKDIKKIKIQKEHLQSKSRDKGINSISGTSKQ